MDGGGKGDDEGSGDDGCSGEGSGGDGAGDVVGAAVGAGVVGIVVPSAILGFETVPAWVVHEVAIVAGAEVAGITWVAVVTADVDGVAGAVVARWLVFAVVIWMVVVVAGDLRLS